MISSRKIREFINFKLMKYRLLKIAALLVILAHLASCYTPVKTDRKYPSHGKYRRAGRFW
jgi:hypothetical protein